LVGVTGHVVEVEADIANGLVGTILVGLPDAALREARDRIRAAIVNSGEEWPQRKITVALSPASSPKRGSWFDLAPPVGVFQKKYREKAEAGLVTTPVRLGRAAGKARTDLERKRGGWPS
jgi:predicted ATPase with chaperone activity